MTRRVGRLVLPWLALLPVGLAAAWLRFHVIESPPLAHLCAELAAPTWCPGREWLVAGFQPLLGSMSLLGMSALLAAAACLRVPRWWMAWLAAAVGLLALQLYCQESGALAVLFGSLRLLRLQLPPPRQQHRPRQRQIHAQP